MDPTTLWVVVANLGFVICCGAIAIRLIALWRRTRELPELFLGSGLACFIVGIPALGIAGMGRTTADQVNLTVAAFGMIALAAGMTSVGAFTWRAFRPRSLWAAGVVAAVAAAEAVIVVGTLQALHTAPVGMPAGEATRSWILWIRVPMMLSCLWSSAEAWGQRVMAMRRGALGLGDSVVENRLLLWCVAGLFSAGNNGFGMLLQVRGMGPTADPIAASAMAIGASTMAILLWLVFLPPKRYLRFIERRAQTASPQVQIQST